MATLTEQKRELKFDSDTLSFEELQELDRIEKEMLAGDFYTVEEVFYDKI